MRTTIKLEGESGEIIQLYANSRSISVSKAIAELVMEAIQPKMRIKYVDGIPVFDIPQGRAITNEEVLAALAEDF